MSLLRMGRVTDKVLCGERFTAKLSLVNTSRTEAIKNMMVTVAPGENVELLGKTDNAYVEELGAGKKCIISFDFRVNASAPGGQYSIGVTMNYADSKGNDYNTEESVKVSAGQKVRIGIDPVQVPKEIQLGETVILQTQGMWRQELPSLEAWKLWQRGFPEIPCMEIHKVR